MKALGQQQTRAPQQRPHPIAGDAQGAHLPSTHEGLRALARLLARQAATAAVARASTSPDTEHSDAEEV